jgi:hypothetical protein
MAAAAWLRPFNLAGLMSAGRADRVDRLKVSVHSRGAGKAGLV